MKINDPARYQRELHGDFSEIDAYFKADRRKQILVAIGIALCLVAIALT